MSPSPDRAAKPGALILGMGDLGRRIALALAAHRAAGQPGFDQLVLAGRDAQVTGAHAALVAACGPVRVRPEVLDLAELPAVTALIRATAPVVILHCASLLSPWALTGKGSPAARALGAAGFALQLPAQLPLLATALRAARAAGFTGPFLNCSYPDVTHALLARRELIPTLGIGNAGMIAKVIEARLRRDQAVADREGPVQVLAHHCHVTAAMTADVRRLPAGAGAPRVWVGARRADDLACQGPALASSRELNALSAAHAVEVALALAGLSAPLVTSAPGPHGRPGGWPVRLRAGQVALALPAAQDEVEALTWSEAAAAGDGLARLDADGTAHFTEAAQRAVAPLDPALAAPLAPGAWLARAALLRRHVEAA